MKKKSTHRKPKKKFFSKGKKSLPLWIFSVVLLVLLFAFFTGGKSLFNLYALYQERNELREQKEKLEAENQRLLKEIEKLQNDIDYIEKVAREKYNLKREDEEVFKVNPE